MDNKYIYCFIRKDLPIHQQIIQTAHACFDQGTKEETQTPPNLVLFQVKDQKELLKVKDYLNKHKFFYSMFLEPDFGDEYTSICTEIIKSEEDRAFFENFKLY